VLLKTLQKIIRACQSQSWGGNYYTLPPHVGKWGGNCYPCRIDVAVSGQKMNKLPRPNFHYLQTTFKTATFDLLSITKCQQQHCVTAPNDDNLINLSVRSF